ncbi:MAG: limonene-1,2-epoxide hydrolase family protein [Alphaproteobacteria bacterium]|jgi:limonene-1,2-epoxide hydrolase|nr:limonene-1,2-epoxide hydrolase family protein [Alphaproteobacteria bacterium]
MNENENLVRDFIAAWSCLDAAELAGYFTDDGCYHNMPFQPVQGRDKVERFIAGFIKDWTATEWEIVSLTSQDDRVAVERVDRTRLGDKGVDLPCFGLFEMSEGKIKVWRDYFDLATYTSAAA